MTPREAQEWLCLHGLHVEIDGIVGPATQAALRAFQSRAHLPAAEFGAVGHLTEIALCSPMTRVLAHASRETLLGDRVAEYARLHLDAGAREVGGPNAGPWVRLYMGGHEGPSYPWCAGFVSYVIGQASGNGPRPVMSSYSCDVLATDAKRRGRFVSGRDVESGAYVPRPGDLFIVRRTSTDWVHTGIVTSFADAVVETIEGNTNKAGEREGTEVRARRRGLASLDFVRVGQ